MRARSRMERRRGLVRARTEEASCGHEAWCGDAQNGAEGAGMDVGMLPVGARVGGGARWGVEG